MRGSSFGKMFTVTTFGESHGMALGAIIDGVPANLDVNLNQLQEELRRRAPGQLKGHTERKEEDEAEVLSGIFEGKTLGTPIAVIVRNKNQKSDDYKKLQNIHRPGHGDKTTELKYGIRDYRGGGRSSGRETLSRVIGGYFASLVIPSVSVTAFVSQIGSAFKIDDPRFKKEIHLGKYNFPQDVSDEDIEKFLLRLKEEGDSVGGKISIRVTGVPPGLGEPVFDKLKADFAKAFLSIGGCVGFSYGAGDRFALLNGKEIALDQEAFSGIEGGISNGDDIYMELIFKAPSTVGEAAKEGRHDPCILPRAVPVVESMAKIVLADHFLRQKSYEGRV